MKQEKLLSAIAEAERFLKRAKDLARKQRDDEARVKKHNSVPRAWNDTAYTNDFRRENGDVRRASMDLTRSLADLRRPS